MNFKITNTALEAVESQERTHMCNGTLLWILVTCFIYSYNDAMITCRLFFSNNTKFKSGSTEISNLLT